VNILLQILGSAVGVFIVFGVGIAWLAFVFSQCLKLWAWMWVDREEAPGWRFAFAWGTYIGAMVAALFGYVLLVGHILSALSGGAA
jgi:hypothetical protein